MKYYYKKKLISGALSVVLAVTFINPVHVTADELDTEIPSAGAALVIEDYIQSSGNDNIAAYLPKEPETQAVNKTTTTTEKKSSESELFSDIAIAKVSGGSDDYVNVRKKPNTESKILGRIYNNCGARITQTTKNGWYKITSGNCVGYIKSDFFVTGAKAENIALDTGYVIATIKDSGVHVREKNSTDSKVVTNVYKNEPYSVKKFDSTGNWIKIRIGDGVSGWISAQYAKLSIDMDTALTMKEIRAAEKRAREEQQRLLEEQQKALEAEQATQAPNTPTQSYNAPTQAPQTQQPQTQQPATSAPTTTGSGKGASVVAYAKQFLGNPYVYGGSSLTNGTDCSGFTMSVYAHFGYGLNRSSYTQVNNGTAVSLSNLQPGDLLFYKYNGATISHVAMYIGGGQIIHASTEETGIIISGMGSPCAARRIIN